MQGDFVVVKALLENSYIWDMGVTMNKEISDYFLAKELALVLAEDLLAMKEIQLPVLEMLDSMCLAYNNNCRVNGLSGSVFEDAFESVKAYAKSPTGTNLRKGMSIFAPLALCSSSKDFSLPESKQSKIIDRNNNIDKLEEDSTRLLRLIQKMSIKDITEVIKSSLFDLEMTDEEKALLESKIRKIVSHRANPNIKSAVYAKILDNLIQDRVYTSAVDKVCKKTKRVSDIKPSSNQFYEHIYDVLCDKYGVRDFVDGFTADYPNSSACFFDRETFADSYFVRRVNGISPEESSQIKDNISAIKRNLIQNYGTSLLTWVDRTIENGATAAAITYSKKYGFVLPTSQGCENAKLALMSVNDDETFDKCYDLGLGETWDKGILGAIAFDLINKNGKGMHTLSYVIDAKKKLAQQRKAETPQVNAGTSEELDYEEVQKIQLTTAESKLISLLSGKEPKIKVSGLPDTTSLDYQFSAEEVKSKLVSLIGDIAKNEGLPTIERISQIEELVQGYENV